MSFAALKKQGSLLEKLNSEINKTEVTSGFIDDRLWKPQMGKDGIGSAIIRFLPPAKGNELPWAKVWSHAFQGPGGWYIENSLTTIGGNDPVGELNRTLWNSGLDSDKEIARKQKRKLSYYSNIYVIKDPANPANEGKTFLYKYGKKIHDKIIAVMQPEFEGEDPINPFDFWQGADFNLRIKKVAGFWNYDSSVFGRPSTLASFDDAKLEEIYNGLWDLNEFTGASNFKTYAELKKRLDTVLKGGGSRIDEEELENEVAAKFDSRPPAPAPTPSATAAGTPSSVNTDEDAFSYFDQLANEQF
tara:strand:+ start:2344 stop:3249 length:906 start_codon:yes stop_codon:yes gene_type:complete